MKEDEFSTLCSELQVIKDTTLGKFQKKNDNNYYITYSQIVTNPSV